MNTSNKIIHTYYQIGIALILPAISGLVLSTFWIVNTLDYFLYPYSGCFVGTDPDLNTDFYSNYANTIFLCFIILQYLSITSAFFSFLFSSLFSMRSKTTQDYQLISKGIKSLNIGLSTLLLFMIITFVFTLFLS